MTRPRVAREGKSFESEASTWHHLFEIVAALQFGASVNARRRVENGFCCADAEQVVRVAQEIQAVDATASTQPMAPMSCGSVATFTM